MALNVLLISVPIRLRQKPYWYIGVAAIAAAAEAAGHNVRVLDLNMLRPRREDIAALLRGNEYDVAAVSAMVTCFPIVRDIAAELRSINPGAPIVLGGTLASTSFDLVLPNSEVNIAVVGEGEATFTELLAALEEGRDWKATAGIGYLEDGQVKTGGLRDRIMDLDGLPFPAYHLFDFPRYVKTFTFPGVPDGKTAPMISGRGCPYDCTFCYKTFQRRVTFRSAENIIREIEFLYRDYGIRGILFVDDLFVIDKKRVVEFCDRLSDSGMRLKWGCLGRAGVVNDNIIRTLKAAGCVWMGYGLESGSQKMLDAMKKRITVEQAEEAVNLTRKHGLVCSPTFMIGIPGETRDTVMETVDFFDRTDLTPTRLFIANPYPGSELYDYALSKGWITDRLDFRNHIDDAVDLSVNLTDMSDRELTELRREAELLIHNSYYRRHRIKNLWDNNAVRRFYEVTREKGLGNAAARVRDKLTGGNRGGAA